MSSGSLDPLMFGQRLRHVRRQAGTTLEALGDAIGRSPSYLSQLENGHREPKLSTISQLAAALNCRPADLLSQAAPNRRAELEVTLARIQDDPRYQALRLPYLRATAQLDTGCLGPMVAPVYQVCAPSPGPNPGGVDGGLAGTLGA